MLRLLNNDIDAISPNWLEGMASHVAQKGVGAVGAKLLYPDGRVQHAGATVGPGGCANHVHLYVARHEPGYCYCAVIAQEFSAVTAACLLTWKSHYERLGGLLCKLSLSKSNAGGSGSSPAASKRKATRRPRRRLPHPDDRPARPDASDSLQDARAITAEWLKHYVAIRLPDALERVPPGR